MLFNGNCCPNSAIREKMANLELRSLDTSSRVSVITLPGTASTGNQPALIPAILHMPSSQAQPPSPVQVAAAPIFGPNLRQDPPPLLALPEGEEAVVRSRICLYTSGGIRIYALVESLRRQMAAVPLEAAQLFEAWPALFAELKSDDRQPYVDALAMLLLGVIRPILLNAEDGSPEQAAEALQWDEEMEAIFAQLWPDIHFDACIQECDTLMREEENTQLLCTRLDHTLHVQARAAASMLSTMRLHVTEGFVHLRQRFINLQQARQRLRRNLQVDAVMRRTEQIAQSLLYQTRELATLSRVFLEQARRHDPILAVRTLRVAGQLLQLPARAMEGIHHELLTLATQACDTLGVTDKNIKEVSIEILEAYAQLPGMMPEP